MEKTIKKLPNNGEKILVSCAGCYNTLKNDYNKLFGVKLNVKHASMLLNELILEGKINIKKTHQKVTYHDPCHLGRHCNIYEQPRQIIKNTSILVEMDRNRERARCCGAVAGVKSAFPDIALKIALKRIEDAKVIDAEIIITSCSFCILNLKNAFKYGLNNDIMGSVSNILDISELVVMGLEYEGF